MRRTEQSLQSPDCCREVVRKSVTPSQMAAYSIVGVDKLLTGLAKCCKPAPPDPIIGFVTRGRGITIHRQGCASLSRLTEESAERLIAADWDRHIRKEGAIRSISRSRRWTGKGCCAIFPIPAGAKKSMSPLPGTRSRDDTASDAIYPENHRPGSIETRPGIDTERSRGDIGMRGSRVVKRCSLPEGMARIMRPLAALGHIA